MSVVLAVDAMGGDNAPGMIVDGVLLAHQKYPDVKYILFGDETKIKPFFKGQLYDFIEIYHTTDFITADMKPSLALRQSKESSMRLAIEAVKDGRAHAVVSSGNTGAYMALSKIILKTLKGIDRPALISPVPTMNSYSVMLDLGANIECSTDNLSQFALMGQAYARYILKRDNPSIGLLNIGAEDLKGNENIKLTHTLLKEAEWITNFHGFVEGDDILTGVVDVIVTDGFTGNIALKTAEGVFNIFKTYLANEYKKSFSNKLRFGAFSPVLKTFKKKYDPRQYNGAPFLGLDGIAVKSHGGTDAFGFSAALGVAVDLVDNQVNDHIAEGLEKWQSYVAPPEEINDDEAVAWKVNS